MDSFDKTSLDETRDKQDKSADSVGKPSINFGTSKTKLDLFWHDLSQGQQELIREGQFLGEDVLKEHKMSFKDYSFMIFPFAKAYEGYLKKLFLDVKFISHLDYISDHLRLGKLLSPNLMARLGDRSLYEKIKDRTTVDLADRIWQSWKIGRNQVFHYFPHNYKAVNYEDALQIIDEIVATMGEAYSQLKSQNSKVKNTT